jgi:hypothetical protein
MTLTRHCSVCDDERSFDQPPCAECGMAIVLGDAPELPMIVRSWAA